MNRREKILATCVGGLIGVFVIGFGVRTIIVKPLKEIDKRTSVLRDKIYKVRKERSAYFEAEDRMKAFTLQTYADTVDQASAKSGEMLTKLILKSGLPEEGFTRLPVGPRKLRGAQEIGWNVQGDGGLADVIDLIFYLQSVPYLQRIEGLTINSGDAPGLVRVRFRCLTLVMDPAPDVQRKELAVRHELNSPERLIFDGIVTRDILRPYFKRPPPAPKTPVAPGSGVATTPSGVPPGPETFKIVSLSEWKGQPEIHVRDLTQQTTQQFRPGDELAGGTIVCIDYRSFPMPGNELLRSDSRVILKIGRDYFAIERGKTLADKRKLTLAQLPAELAKAK